MRLRAAVTFASALKTPPGGPTGKTSSGWKTPRRFWVRSESGPRLRRRSDARARPDLPQEWKRLSDPHRLLLRPGARDARDLRRRAAGFLGDVAVLFHEEAVGRLVAVDAAGERARHFTVGALRAVFVGDVEHDEFGVQSRFSRHDASLYFRWSMIWSRTGNRPGSNPASCSGAGLK